MELNSNGFILNLLCTDCMAHSFVIRSKRQEIRHSGMTLLIFEAVKLLAIDPIAIRLVGIEFYLQYARFMVSLAATIRILNRFFISVLTGLTTCPHAKPLSSDGGHVEA